MKFGQFSCHKRKKIIKTFNRKYDQETGYRSFLFLMNPL